MTCIDRRSASRCSYRIHRHLGIGAIYGHKRESEIHPQACILEKTTVRNLLWNQTSRFTFIPAEICVGFRPQNHKNDESCRQAARVVGSLLKSVNRKSNVADNIRSCCCWRLCRTSRGRSQHGPIRRPVVYGRRPNPGAVGTGDDLPAMCWTVGVVLGHRIHRILLAFAASIRLDAEPGCIEIWEPVSEAETLEG